MVIEAKDIGKKYGKTWIFRDQSFTVQASEPMAITGRNGAGKSTMLQILAGFLTPSQGQIFVDGKQINESGHGTSFIGPYTEIIEEFTLREFLEFHQKFKEPTKAIEEMAESASLPLDKTIADFSTGMKQRTKLLTAFFFENDLTCMDEPTSNLDAEGFKWWEKCIEGISDRFLIIASNDKNEIDVCTKQLDL